MKEPWEQKYQPIENYGIVGNLDTVALVSLHASIDFMCFMRFDSPTIFCKLLDAEKGGSFSIAPLMQDMVTKQLYLPDTNVLVTRFLADDGIAEIIDYMPINKVELTCVIIRKITTVRGNINYRMACQPRFNYAREGHTLKQERDAFLLVPDTNTETPLRLLSDVKLAIDGYDIVSEFNLKEGETTYFVLEDLHNVKNRKGTLQEYVATTFQETVNYWQNWIAKSTYKGQWQDVVNRSALILKLLTSREFGSMIASPTFSLPESVGHARNWDYRYTWIRDAAFSMHAFLELGFKEEAAAFLNWIKKQSTDKELQLMFAIDGETKLDEIVLNHLEGYKGSKPVRVGNDAHKQIQMDIYGELLETLYIFSLHDGDINYDYWQIITKYIAVVMDNWKKPDHSIWEVRAEKREFLFSAVMNWIALDRAIKIAEKHSFPYDILEWHKIRNEIYKDIYENFWSEEKQAFVQFKGSANLDSSALIMPILNMVSPFLDRWQKTMLAIEKELRSDVLVYRYKEQRDEIDGLQGHEGTFTMCSFWYVECLALSGEIEKARVHFEKTLGYSNHLGLFSEQLGRKGEFLGNFPQAFTHLALISAAIELNKTQDIFSTKPSAFNRKMK
jgi:GH15 family glucan-1,4-alpha-glucosidase